MPLEPVFPWEIDGDFWGIGLSKTGQGHNNSMDSVQSRGNLPQSGLPDRCRRVRLEAAPPSPGGLGESPEAGRRHLVKNCQSCYGDARDDDSRIRLPR